MTKRPGFLGQYILVGKLAVPEPDGMKWAVWFETADRQVASTKVGGVKISTVFLGLDHSFGRGLPLLFETVAFGGASWRDLDCERCGTWQEAEEQHKRMVEKVRRQIKEKVNE